MLAKTAALRNWQVCHGFQFTQHNEVVSKPQRARLCHTARNNHYMYVGMGKSHNVRL